LVFRVILRDLVAAVDGALAALFIDHHGEAVDAFGSLPDYDLKIIGAYQGIYLGQIEAICRAMAHGGAAQLKIEWDRATILNTVVDDEYYLVLVLASGANEGIAWRELARTRERVRQEM
jgi:predicted regulator of Ras-like GTPase activity (Roadblock/LC7/MglB family)